MWLEENLIGYFTLYEIKFPLALLDSSPVKLYFRPIASIIRLFIKYVMRQYQEVQSLKIYNLLLGNPKVRRVRSRESWFEVWYFHHL